MAFTPVITNGGRAMLAASQSGGGAITPVTVLTGDGALTLDQDPTLLTALINDIQDYDIGSSNALVPYQASFQFLIDSSEVVETYQLREVGLVCTCPGYDSNTPTMVYYANAGDTPDTITPSDGASAVIDQNFFAIVFSDDVNTFATLTAAVPPALHAITHLGGDTGTDPIPTATSSSLGLTPQTNGDATQVLLGGVTASWGTVPAHAPSHTSLGADPIALATVPASGLLKALSGNNSDVLHGDHTWGVIPLHGSTHISTGTDPVPVVSTSATGLTPHLSGDSTTFLNGQAGWALPVPTGTVVDFIANTPPAGWLVCDGSSLLRTSFPALFAVIGTTFGSADGTHFNIPDLRGRTVIGAGNGVGLTSRALGVTLGEETHVLAVTEMPAHAHTLTDPGHNHGVSDPTHTHAIADPTHAHGLTDPGHSHNFPVGPPLSGSEYIQLDALFTGNQVTSASATGISIHAASTGIDVLGAATGISIAVHATGVTAQNTGGGASHNNMQPSIALVKIIRT